MRKRSLFLSVLSAAAAFGLVACGGSSSSTSSSTSSSSGSESSTPSSSSSYTRAKTKIAVGLYTLTGNHKDALEAYLAPIATAENIEFTYFETGYDGTALLSAVNKQIASGAQGIITTMDGGTAVYDACEENKVYYAGYLCDFNTSYEDLKDTSVNPYFLGTAVDGPVYGTAWGEHIASRIIEDGKKSVAMVKFPAYAYPHQAEMDSGFRAKIDAYNATAAEADKIKVGDTTEMPFFGFDVQGFMSANEGCDAIYAMCGGIDTIYPSMTDNQKANVALYSAGYNVNITSKNDFGEGHCIQEMVYSNVEGITYPLVNMLNKIDNKDFADMPTTAERIEASQVIIQTGDDLDYVQAHSIYHTAKASDAFLTPAEFHKLLAVEGGTYAGLVNSVTHMTLSDLRARNA